MRISVDTHIAAPVEMVFALCTDFKNAPGRIKGIKKIELLNDEPVGVGLRFRETRIMFGREASEEMEITSFEPNRSYTLGCNSCGCVYTSVLRFQPDNGGTKLTMDFDAKPVTFMAKLMTPLGWLMQGTMRKCVQQDLDDIKAYAEEPPAGAV